MVYRIDPVGIAMSRCSNNITALVLDLYAYMDLWIDRSCPMSQVLDRGLGGGCCVDIFHMISDKLSMIFFDCLSFLTVEPKFVKVMIRQVAICLLILDNCLKVSFAPFFVTRQVGKARWGGSVRILPGFKFLPIAFNHLFLLASKFKLTQLFVQRLCTDSLLKSNFRSYHWDVFMGLLVLIVLPAWLKELSLAGRRWQIVHNYMNTIIGSRWEWI